MKWPREARPQTSHERYGVGRTWWGSNDGTEGKETVSGDLRRDGLERRSGQKEPVGHTQWPELYLTVSIFTKGMKGVP